MSSMREWGHVTDVRDGADDETKSEGVLGTKKGVKRC